MDGEDLSVPSECGTRRDPLGVLSRALVLRGSAGRGGGDPCLLVSESLPSFAGFLARFNRFAGGVSGESMNLASIDEAPSISPFSI